MSYTDGAALASDPTWIGRVNACVTTEAIGMSTPFADRLMSSWGWGASIFMPFLVASPGFDKAQDQITDGDLLAAVQAHWSRVESLYST